jgi:hypothetical protein
VAVQSSVWSDLGRNRLCDVPEHVLDASGISGAAAVLMEWAPPVLIWVSTIRPARVAAIRRAFSNWSAKRGTITSGGAGR